MEPLLAERLLVDMVPMETSLPVAGEGLNISDRVGMTSSPGLGNHMVGNPDEMNEVFFLEKHEETGFWTRSPDREERRREE